jgi:isopentenyldiphosphate isomerase
MQEILDIVDENNTVVGIATKDEILKKNLIHRGVVVFLFDSKHKIFIHQRTENKMIYPNMWNMTLGGSVASGESFLEAAI